jgi:hypothetical protein
MNSNKFKITLFNKIKIFNNKKNVINLYKKLNQILKMILKDRFKNKNDKKIKYKLLQVLLFLKNFPYKIMKTYQNKRLNKTKIIII